MDSVNYIEAKWWVEVVRLITWPPLEVIEETTIYGKRWETLAGGYKDVLPYFLKSERMTVPELADNTKYHSTSGELSISFAPYRTSIADAVVQGGAELGYNVIDYNGET